LFSSPLKVSSFLSLIAKRGLSVISSFKLSRSSGVSKLLSNDDSSNRSEGLRSSTSSGSSGCCYTTSARDSLKILATMVLDNSTLVIINSPAIAITYLGGI